MKAHEYWSVGALITMLGTFYSGYKGSNQAINILRQVLCFV